MAIKFAVIVRGQERRAGTRSPGILPRHLFPVKRKQATSNQQANRDIQYSVLFVFVLLTWPSSPYWPTRDDREPNVKDASGPSLIYQAFVT